MIAKEPAVAVREAVRKQTLVYAYEPTVRLETSPKLKVHTKKELLERVKWANDANAQGKLIPAAKVFAGIRERYGIYS